MRCPICGSDNYRIVDLMDCDESDNTVEFECLGKCGRKFFGIYSFLYFEDDEGNTIDGDY